MIFILSKIYRYSILFLILLIQCVTACAQVSNTVIKEEQVRYAVIPENPRPGDPVTIGVNSGVTDARLFFGDKQIVKAPFFLIQAERNNPEFLASVITIPATIDINEENKTVVFKLFNNDEQVTEIPVELTVREFIEEVIYLDPVNTGIRTDVSPQRVEESNHLWRILSTTGDTVYHTGPFLPPTTATRRTSFFGSRRIFQHSTGARDMSIHAGVDFGIPRGTRVDASGSGRVVLARMRIVTGNSVILEHAPGIYSLYYHMDSISVKEGDIVQTGDQLGLSGSTGLSTGPHLHWEVRVHTENTDPDALVERQLVDKDLIINKIYKRR